MAWIDDRIWCHPKFADLPAPAFRAYINGIAYSSGFGTRGHLSSGQLRAISAEARVKRSLINAGLWDAAEDGINIHDWEDHNGKRDARREADRERKRLLRGADKSTGQSAGQSAGSSCGPSTGPSTVAAHVDGSDGSDFELQALNPKAEPLPEPARESLPITPTPRDPLDTPGILLDALPDADPGTETVLRSFRLPEFAYRQAIEQVQSGHGGTALAVTILKRCRDELEQAAPDPEDQARLAALAATEPTHHWEDE